MQRGKGVFNWCLERDLEKQWQELLALLIPGRESEEARIDIDIDIDGDRDLNVHIEKLIRIS